MTTQTTHRQLHTPTIVEVTKVEQSTPIHTTVCFDYAPPALPGQFVMVWLPGIDEIPMSLSKVGVHKAMVARGRGDATKAICNLGVGDRIGIRGPYGRPFVVTHKRNIAVGGGTGMAPLLPLLRCGPKGVHWDLIVGAATAKELLYLDWAAAAAANDGVKVDVHSATEDGSAGTKGYPTAVVEKLLSRGGIDEVFTCGPELLMHGVFKACERFSVPLQASMERYMKCGFGICDACALSGYLTCLDGPVFRAPQLRQMEEFGRYHRSAAGLPEHL